MIALLKHYTLAEYERMYDPKYRLLKLKVAPELQHPYTLLDVKYAHEFLTSANYALTLLDFGTPDAVERAAEILDVCISSREKAKNMFLPYFYEELELDNPNSEHLLNETTRIVFIFCQIIDRFHNLISAEMLNKLEDFCLNYTFMIIQQYSKSIQIIISLCEIYICSYLGKLYSNTEFINYANQKLYMLYFSVMEHKSFPEYRSLDSNISIGNILQCLCEIFTDSKSLSYISELNYIYWEPIAKAFHYKTGEICGPHHRADSIFTGEIFKSYIDCATNHMTKLCKNPMFEFAARCPADLLPYFSGNLFMDFSQNLISSGISYPVFLFPSVSTTYIRPDYCIGSQSREEFWYVRHPLIGYFGGREAPYSVRCTVIHDGHDFSSAMLHSVQYHGTILGHVTLQTNRGDRHINLDGPCKTFTAKELIMRFEIIGKTSELQVTHFKNSLQIKYENINIDFSVPFLAFDDNIVNFHLSEFGDRLCFDAILHKGSKKFFNLEKVNKLILCFVLKMSTSAHETYGENHEIKGDLLCSQIKTDGHMLSLETPVKPGEFQHNSIYDKQFFDGKLLEQVAQINTARLQNYTLIEKTKVYPPSSSPAHIDILTIIDRLKYTDIFNISAQLPNIFKSLGEFNFDITILRRYIVHIAINILEAAGKKNVHFTHRTEYYNINLYQKISNAITSKQLESIIYNMLQKIEDSLKKYEEKKNEKNLIDIILNYIHAHYLDYNFSLTTLASDLNVSSAYLSKYFKNAMGCKFIDYVNNMKVNYTKGLLKKEKISVDELSSRLGYANSASFIRMFKNYTGMTLSRYISENQPFDFN